MEYCAPRALPHSTFLSWRPLDQDKALAWLIDQRSRCQHCGSYTEDWLDEEGRDIVPEPYHPEVEVCLGCKALAQERERISKSKVKHQEAYHTHLRPGPPPEPEYFEEDQEELE